MCLGFCVARLLLCRAEVDGRIVVDILRQVITSSQLASFSLIDCVQTLLGQTLEVGWCGAVLPCAELSCVALRCAASDYCIRVSW